MPHATQLSTSTFDPARARRGGVARVEVRWKEGLDDPLAAALLQHARDMGLAPSGARSAKVYLLEGPLSDEQLRQIVEQLLVSPVVEEACAGAAPTPAGACTVEVHPLPGVMNPTALTVAQQISELFGAESVDAAAGWRCDFMGLSPSEAEEVVRTAPGGLCNPVVHAILREPLWPEALPHGRPREPRVQRVQLRGLDDEQLLRLSREGHLFLSLEEMRAVQAHFDALGRDPTDVELETIAQTWSEHCVHKTLKSTIRYECPGESRIDFAGRPGVRVENGGVVVIDNLLKRTIAHATHRLIEEGLDWTLSVFEDNAGVIAFDDEHGVCVKVETHNHPSAIEPYGGAATGVGGCIRDILGTGLGARPIAATDVFCVAPPDARDVPGGCLPPRRILTDVVAGVRDYGNRMGVPTVAGAVFFDERYVGNPLVYCGCVGIMPRSMVRKGARPGDLIVVLGGRTGRDGVHGATFSSAQLESGHAEEFSHAVQIGNPIEERKVHDALLRARDARGGPLFSAVTDCGAGGFSSAVGEMGAKIGAEVDLAKAPLKYEGLSPAEIWISEAQERMVLAVPPEKLEALQRICEEESVELAVLGTFGTEDAELIVWHGGLEAARLSMAFLHEGLPRTQRLARNAAPAAAQRARAVSADADLGKALLQLLAHPDVASKRWIVRQYDHEVQGDTVVKPLVGAMGDGPGDAAALEPVAGSGRGLALACGLQLRVGDPRMGGDAYDMALASVDECVRNLVCVGARADRVALLDNFCWPSCDKPENLATLVRAAFGCADAALAYRAPFISGKDSLNNQFVREDGSVVEIPPTLLITGVGIVDDIARCVTMDAKRSGSALVLVSASPPALACSLLGRMDERFFAPGPARVDAARCAAAARFVSEAIAQGRVLSAHDCSEGGALVAVAEMLIAAADQETAGLGATLRLGGDNLAEACFGEGAGRYLLEVEQERAQELIDAATSAGLEAQLLGDVDQTGQLRVVDETGEQQLCAEVQQLRSAWLGTLDW